MRLDRRHPSSCWVCGKHAKDGTYISATGLCNEHSKQRFEENFDAMKSKRGPFAQHWATRLAISVGFGPLDDVTTTGHSDAHG